jgi:hypothetical protein
MDQIAGSEPARGLKPRGASLSHRPDPTSTSLYEFHSHSLQRRGAAAVAGANDREAPYTHSVTSGNLPPNGSERLCCITLMSTGSHHHHRHWLHRSAHVLVDRCSHELDES